MADCTASAAQLASRCSTADVPAASDSLSHRSAATAADDAAWTSQGAGSITSAQQPLWLANRSHDAKIDSRGALPAMPQLSPTGKQGSDAGDWRGGSSDWSAAQQQKWQQQQQQQHSQTSFTCNGFRSGEVWQLDAAGLGLASHGSSSDCLADALAATLQHYSSDDCGADTLDAAADCLSAWPGGCGSQPTVSIRISDAPVQLPLGQSGLCSSTQHGIAASAGLSPPCSSAVGATAAATDSAPVDWQSLLEAWALPPEAAAAVVPPPLEALLAEEDAMPLPTQHPAPQLPAPQPLTSQPLAPPPVPPPQQPLQGSARLLVRSAPDQPRQMQSPPAVPLADAHSAAVPPVPRRARSFRNRQKAAQPPTAISQPAVAQPASTRSRRLASRSAKATDVATATQIAQAAAVASAAPAAAAAGSRKLAPAIVQPPPSLQQQLLQAEAAAKASGVPAIPQPSPPLQQAASGPQKRGRPRVYDTVTPVLEAAALERQPSGAPGAPGYNGASEEPPRKRRGAKPKYICATQEEAIAKRRDRNRQTALATYYRRKARIAELRGIMAALEAENAALDTLADAAEGSEECAGYIRPLLEGGCEPAIIVALLLPDGDSS